MTIQVLRPEVLFDSILVVMGPDFKPAKPRRAIGPRDEFAEFFGSKLLDPDPSQLGYGIPQFLRLMNARDYNPAKLPAHLRVTFAVEPRKPGRVQSGHDDFSAGLERRWGAGRLAMTGDRR